MKFVPNKYKEGEIVCAKEEPSLRLIIRRYLDMIYYCKALDFPHRREMVYFERELAPCLPGTTFPQGDSDISSPQIPQ